jgi:hypothetical protein
MRRLVSAGAAALVMLVPLLLPAVARHSLAAATRQRPQVVSARAGLVTRVEGEVRCHHHEREGGVEELHAGERIHDDDIVFTNETGSPVVVKKGRSVTFRKAEKR